MTQELFDENLERLSRYSLKSSHQLLDGYMLFVKDKIFVDFNGCFVFHTQRDAIKQFRKCCRDMVRKPYNDFVYNERQSNGQINRQINVPVTTEEWREFKKKANVRVVKYERETN